MGIYIKGVEMPKDCSVCKMLEGDAMDGMCHAANRWLDDDEYWMWCVDSSGEIYIDKPCNCPIVPVPPHGRLIDADALPKYEKPIGKRMMFGGEYVYTQTEIKNAQTIIPPEEKIQ